MSAEPVRRGRRRPRIQPFGRRAGPDSRRRPGSVRQPGPRVAADRLARAPARGRRRRRPRQLRRDGASGPSGPAAIVFVHGLSGCWQNWLENIPHFARDHRVLALDLPGLRPLARCPPGRSRSELRPARCTTSATRSGSATARVVGNSMGGFIAAEAAIAEPDRFEKLVLVSAAGVSSARLRREPAEIAGADGAGRGAARCSALQSAGMRRPRVRWRGLQGLFQHPERAAPRAALEQFSQRRPARPGFLPRRPGPGRLRHPRPADRGRGADADRLGPQRPRRPARRTRSATRSACATRGP